jgi:hypothetical protein
VHTHYDTRSNDFCVFDQPYRILLIILSAIMVLVASSQAYSSVLGEKCWPIAKATGRKEDSEWKYKSLPSKTDLMEPT